MSTLLNGQSGIIRTERGLTLAGTRITVYDVMDYLAASWPPQLIRDRLNLTNEQITAVLDYISAHRSEVEAEYQTVLQTAQEIRQYWEERNRDRLVQAAHLPAKPGQEVIKAKLQAWKKELEDLAGDYSR